MTTMVKERVETRNTEAETLRPAAAAPMADRWEPTPQPRSNGTQAGLLSRIVSLLVTLDRALAGPPMTAQQRVQKQVAEAQDQRDFGLLAR